MSNWSQLIQTSWILPLDTVAVLEKRPLPARFALNGHNNPVLKSCQVKGLLNFACRARLVNIFRNDVPNIPLPRCTLLLFQAGQNRDPDASSRITNQSAMAAASPL